MDSIPLDEPLCWECGAEDWKDQYHKPGCKLGMAMAAVSRRLDKKQMETAVSPVEASIPCQHCGFEPAYEGFERLVLCDECWKKFFDDHDDLDDDDDD